MSTKISELSAAGSANGTDELPTNQGGTTRKVTVAQIATNVTSGLTKSSVGLGNVDNTSDADKPISSATQTALNGKQDAIAAPFNELLYYTAGGDVEGVPGLSRNPGEGGLSQSLTINPNNEAGGAPVNSIAININPIAHSPDREYTVSQLNVAIDTDVDGFSLGTTNNRSVTVASHNIQHQGSSDIGAITFLNNYLNVGNNVDALTCDGFAYAFGFGSINDNVTIDGAMQGYIYQPNISAAATLSSNSYTVAFGDFANIGTMSYAYQSMVLGPTVDEIANNNGFTSVNISPTINTLNGNAGVTGIFVGGSLGTFDTGFYSGIQISPTIADIVNATGLVVNMAGVTASGSVKAADFTGDVSIDGDLTFSGALAIGQLNAFYSATVQSMIAFNPTTIHGLISGINAPDSVTTTDADTIGVNTAMLIQLEDDSYTTSGPFQLGFTALALPCVVLTGTNSYIDYISGTTTAINLSTSTGGTIDHLRITRAVAIPNGVTTVNHSYGFFYHEPFGGVSADNFSFYGEDAPGYFEAGLKIGGTPGTDDRPDSGVLFHVEGATQLDGDVGFFGTTPASQQTGGAATAGGTYTTTEQDMLQKAYDALRAYGLLT